MTSHTSRCLGQIAPGRIGAASSLFTRPTLAVQRRGTSVCFSFSSSWRFGPHRTNAAAAAAALVSCGLSAWAPSTATSLRWCSRSATAGSDATRASSSPSSSSAVNVEDFTLNEEVVQRDLAHLEKWNALAERMDTARTAGDHKTLLQEALSGLNMLEELGADNAPVQCEPLLCMEAAQAHVQLQSYDQAIELLSRATKALELPAKVEQRDMATIAECKLLHSHVLVLQGNGKEAQRVAEEILHWIDVDAKTAAPMQAVAALNLKRSVQTALGRALVVQGQSTKDEGVAKPLYGKALDVLIDALNAHIDEKDSVSVKIVLEHIKICFEGVQDIAQAVTTCKKYISWCSRQEDQDGKQYGKQMLVELATRHQLKEELEALEKGEAKV